MTAWSVRDGPELREERKVVTALFADLVGSTTVGAGFDPGDMGLGEQELRSALSLARELACL